MSDDRPGCHCSDCLEADVVYRFNCPECPPDLDGHHIAGMDRAKMILGNHRERKHEAASIEVAWRADDDFTVNADDLVADLDADPDPPDREPSGKPCPECGSRDTNPGVVDLDSGAVYCSPACAGVGDGG